MLELTFLLVSAYFLLYLLYLVKTNKTVNEKVFFSDDKPFTELQSVTFEYSFKPTSKIN